MSPAALQLANPQLSDKDYGLLGKIIQIPAACLGPSIVHIAVPGDTIVDVAKDYDIDPTCLGAGNPQIADPSMFNPGDCIQIPTTCSPSSTGGVSASNTYAELMSISTPPTSTEKSCPFTITASGGVKGIAG